jgi:3-hydroxyisobutyrate dehydrogenase-like beta-hydroxyacid dehydrogenase
MSAISVIGLGAMGGALARAFQRGGHNVTVWNRTAEKMAPFVANGAVGKSDIVEAVTASPVILVCVHSYAATQSILGAENVIPHLSGRTLVQFSTGTPREVQECADWCNRRDVTYVDGAILCLPAAVGSDAAQFLLAGPEVVFKGLEPLLECLGGVCRYLGENIRAAATLDLAWLSQRLGQIIGAIHGVRLCESEDVGIDVYEEMFPEGDRVQILASVIKEGNYLDPDVTVRVWSSVSQRFQEQARDAGINSDFPDFAAGVVERAMRAGYADEDVATLIKVLRDR